MPLAPRTRALVGRTTELERLRRDSGLASSTEGGAVLVSGDAGIGKSRLVAELAAEAERADRLVVAGHCVGAGGDTLAWLPFVELVGELARESSCFDRALDLHPALAVLHPATAPGSEPADPGQVAEGVHALLTAVADERPLMVVVEDVHWSDHSSRDLLTVLLTRGFSAPVTLVVTYRSDDLHRRHPLHEVLTVWTRLPLVSRVDLSPLPSGEMHRLVRDLEDAPTTTTLVTEVVDRSGGNPFFAEEIVAGGDSTATPQDLTRLLRMRLDRLDEPARHLVRAASLAGRSIDPELLGDVTGLDADALDAAFHLAIDHQILEADPRGDFHFRHPLVGETVAAELLPGARRRLHQAWLSALRTGPGRGPAADIARHAAATGDTDTAAAAAIDAGDEAMRMGGAKDAVRLYEKALGWIDGDARRRAEVALAASVAAKAAGDQVRSLDLLEEAIADLPDGEHPRLRAELLVRAAGWYSTLDLPGDPLRMSEEAVALLPEWREPADFDVLMRHLDVLVHVGPASESARLIPEILTRAEELGLTAVIAETRLHEARMLSQVDPVRARAGLLATADDPAAPGPLRLPALLRLGTLERNAGRLEQALGHYLTGVTVADERQRPWGPYGMECRLQGGRAAYELGRWDEAERLLTSPADLPHPPRGFMEGALVELQVARGDDVDPDRLAETQRWWEVDVLLVVACLGGLIDLLGRRDRTTDLLDVVQRGLNVIGRAWSPSTQAIIRLMTLFTGQVADLAARGHDVTALGERSDAYADRLGEFDPGDPQVGPESRAWLVRHDAERLRLAAVTGRRPDPDALVDAWRESAEAFAALANAPEHVRSLARHAEALALVGRAADARPVAAEARRLAEDLGARPIIDLLDGIAGLGDEQPTGTTGSLTPRELEVLDHLDRGRTNGQVADALFISRKTASVHVSNILAKLGAATRGEAVSIARQRGIIG